MARKPQNQTAAEAKGSEPVVNEPKKNPETVEYAEDRENDNSKAVKDLPPANPFNEPVADAYPEGKYAEVTQATLKPAETIVEHPLSPTDSNPNPHGNRDEPGLPSVPVKDKDGNVTVERAEEGDTEVEGVADEVHLGDGRVLHKGGKVKVSKEVAKQLRDNGQAK